VKDAQGPLVQGRTRWRRFAAVSVPAVALAGGIVFGMANGAIAAQFSVSGQPFKISAAKLEGTGFAQYGGVAVEKGGNPQDILGKSHPVATAAIADATLTKLCQSVKVPGAPVSLVIHAGDDPDSLEGLEALEHGEEAGAGSQVHEHHGRLGGHGLGHPLLQQVPVAVGIGDRH